MHAIVLGGSRGIGHAIAKSLHKAGCNVYAASKKDIDTSDLESVKKFASAHPKTDVLVLNTGGPPPMEFDDITEEDWQKYHNQLFLGFCLLVRNVPNQYCSDIDFFLISTSCICFDIKEHTLLLLLYLILSRMYKVFSPDKILLVLDSLHSLDSAGGFGPKV